MAVLTGTAPARVQGLPQPSDNFPRRFRNRAPLAIRQIISQGVLDQWSSDPEHVIQALNQSVQEQQTQAAAAAAASKDDTLGCGAKQETVLLPTGADPAVLLPYLGSSQEGDTPPLSVMVAEDTKNFMDDPQFTKTITMTAREIVARVLAPPSLSSGVVVSTVEEDGMDVINEMDIVVPSLQIHQDAAHHSWICPLASTTGLALVAFTPDDDHGLGEGTKEGSDADLDLVSGGDHAPAL
ncbi:hypothetical protein BGZ67_002562 [Mortierella alpina]|nr:hypothetical protein BGZ67_002562 [Mortierella alpina]